jgi:hypothetical protein
MTLFEPRHFGETPLTNFPFGEIPPSVRIGGGTTFLIKADIHLWQSAFQQTTLPSVQQEVRTPVAPAATELSTATMSGLLKVSGLLVMLLAITGVVGNALSQGIVMHPLLVVVIFLSGLCFVVMGFARPV